MRFTTSAALLALAAIVEPRALPAAGAPEQSVPSLFKRLAAALPVAVPPPSSPPPPSAPKPPPTAPKPPTAPHAPGPPKPVGPPKSPKPPAEPKPPGEPKPPAPPGKKPGPGKKPPTKPTLCKRGGPPCGPDGKPLSWFDEDGAFLEAEDMDEDQKKDFWQFNKQGGQSILKTAKNYIGKKNRIEEPKTPVVNEKLYLSTTESKAKFEEQPGQIDGPFKRSGVDGVNVNADFSLTKVRSSFEKGLTIVELGVGKKTGSMVGKDLNSNHDPLRPGRKEGERPMTEEEKKEADNYVRISDLIWHEWTQKMDAGFKGKTGEEPSRGLNDFEFDTIINDETKALIDIAHDFFPDKVTDKRVADKPSTGHGKWVEGDEAYERLSNAPLIKTIWNMMIDRGMLVDKPYISEIHTEGLDYDPPKADRGYSIVLKFGPPPAK